MASHKNEEPVVATIVNEEEEHRKQRLIQAGHIPVYKRHEEETKLVHVGWITPEDQELNRREELARQESERHRLAAPKRPICSPICCPCCLPWYLPCLCCCLPNLCI